MEANKQSIRAAHKDGTRCAIKLMKATVSQGGAAEETLWPDDAGTAATVEPAASVNLEYLSLSLRVRLGEGVGLGELLLGDIGHK